MRKITLPMSERRRLWRAERIRAHICVNCKNRAMEHATYCRECAMKASKKYAARTGALVSG